MTWTLVSIFVGGFLAYGVGIPWYMILSKPWMAAARVTNEDVNQTSPMPYLMALLAWLVAAAVLNLHIYPELVGDKGVIHALRVTVGLWLCFGLLSTVLSTFFGRRGLNLIWIDGGYTLLGGLVLALCYSLIAV